METCGLCSTSIHAHGRGSVMEERMKIDCLVLFGIKRLLFVSDQQEKNLSMFLHFEEEFFF